MSKSILALVAAVSLGAMTLLPSTADARHRGWHHGWGHHHGWHGWHHHGWRRWHHPRRYYWGPWPYAAWAGPVVVGHPCVRLRRVWTPWGLVWRRVWVC